MMIAKWWTHTWGPWRGCKPCRRKCQACYNAAPDSWFTRYGHDFSKITRAARATFRAPLKYPAGARVAVCLASDFWIEEMDLIRPLAWEIIFARRDLTFIIPTSRAARAAEWFGNRFRHAADLAMFNHVWFLASISEPADLDNLEALLRVPVGHVGVSFEPALLTVYWNEYLQPAAISRYPRPIEWLICGGANHTADPQWACPPETAVSAFEQAKAAGTPWFWKGGGSVTPPEAFPARINVQETPFGAERSAK